MAKGIIYVMTTVVPGLVKIGKTGSSNFDNRMYTLEKNGYSNVVGLKRHFAIEVDDYDEKEIIIDEIFSKSRVENTELFALDINLVVQLLSSFEGKQIYPTVMTKEEVFDDAANKREAALIPDGLYYMDRKVKKWDNRHVKGTMKVEKGVITVLKGSTVCPVKGVGAFAENIHDSAVVKNDILVEDIIVNSPSAAAVVLLYSNANGWAEWKTSDGKPIDIFRKNNK